MKHTLMPLPYEKNALEPHISAETIEYHYGKHHATYVDKLNNLITGTEHENQSLIDIVKSASGAIFNNAAQVWNHDFYWNCLTPEKQDQPGEILAEKINRNFGGLDEFKKQFTEKATGNFGSGWTWLVVTSRGDLEIVNTSNADNPLTKDKKPLLTCDVWEHAYYIDYRNARPKYLESYWEIVNWKFAEDLLEN